MNPLGMHPSPFLLILIFVSGNNLITQGLHGRSRRTRRVNLPGGFVFHTPPQGVENFWEIIIASFMKHPHLVMCELFRDSSRAEVR